jgi:cobalt-zinc-cadmium efflux system outer membrane protein
MKGRSMFDRSRRVIAAVLLCSIAPITGGAAPPGAPSPTDSSGAALRVTREVSTPKTLAELKAAALGGNPRLAEAAANLAQAEAELREAGLYPNPVLSVEGEEYPRNFSTGPGLTMFTINQSIVTGGKRRYRRRGARSGIARAARQYEQEALEVVRDTTRAYFDLLGARRRLELARELVALSAAFRDIVKTRVEGGSTRPIEADRAIVLAAQARADIRKAEADLAIASQALAAAMGLPHLNAAAVQGALEHHGALPPLEVLARLAVERSPLLAIPAAAEQAAVADLGLARAQRIPDIEFGLSAQHRSQPDESHDLRGFQLNVPLPVFNNGQAARAKARAAVRLARAEQASARVNLENRLAQAYRTGQRAHEQVEIYLAEVLPAARHAVELATEGYRAGKFTYLEVLDGQRSFATSTREYIDALVDYQKARAELGEIVAGTVPEIEEEYE